LIIVKNRKEANVSGSSKAGGKLLEMQIEGTGPR
jgi:hypothetical protein